ncbi:cation transporter [Aquabacterium sp. J223]|uniref:cation transporter n=1 Tax=Aquabacterium sp. J223 TaxID=2898431 RepID=UPI0021AD8F8A|nr:cation transporter [Aquabacterium sp. J223]UUX94258.1 cation transporter [Aquabacterium sp. J223]
MSAACHHDHSPPGDVHDARFRRVLWIALALNAGMFLLEIGGSWRSGSVSLLADAIDFFGDALNYGLSLAVLGLAAVWRSRVAWLKGATMGLWGLAVLARAGWSAWTGVVPEAATMGWIGALALAVNVGVAVLLFSHREGDANRRSVWLCSRNDAIGNLAVIAAAAGVFGTGRGWPDLLVAIGMAALALSAARSVLQSASAELRAPAGAAGRPHHAHHPHDHAGHRH